MDLIAWLIEHSIEIISLLVTISGFGFAVKYLIRIEKNQVASIVDSPNSQVLQINGNITNSQISRFKEETKNAVVHPEKIVDEENDARKLINKIEDYLDENNQVSSIAGMALRLAKILKMKEDEEWLSKEVYGFRENLKSQPEDKEKGMKFQKQEEKYKHRGVDAELTLQFNQREPQTFPLRVFMSQPLSQIEDLIGKEHSEMSPEKRSNLFVMYAPPLQIMVDTLDVDPNEKIPYIIDRGSLSRIPSEVKLKITKFLDNVKNKMNNGKNK